MNQNNFALTLSSDAFNALKSDFNQLLRQTLTSMENKEAENATLTVKLGISLSKEMIPDSSVVSHDAQREITRPKFDHKVNSVIQYKSEKCGSLCGDYELIWDKNLGEYVLCMITNGQICLFDDKFSTNENPEIAIDVSADSELAARNIAGLLQDVNNNNEDPGDYDYENPETVEREADDQ